MITIFIPKKSTLTKAIIYSNNRHDNMKTISANEKILSLTPITEELNQKKKQSLSRNKNEHV